MAQAPNRLRIRNGSDPQAYALAPLGAKSLKLHRGVEILADHRWTQKNRELRPGTIQHDLATSRFMAQLYRDTVEAGEGVRLIYQQEFETQPNPVRILADIDVSAFLFCAGPVGPLGPH